MKKLLSIVLSAAMLAGMLAGCSVKETSPTAGNITAASSDAAKYAEWLSERLDNNVPDDVVLGIGNNKACGVDMSDFEDDGYVIKKLGDETVIFGKTLTDLTVVSANMRISPTTARVPKTWYTTRDTASTSFAYSAWISPSTLLNTLLMQTRI